MTLSATTLDAGGIRERLLAGHVNNELWNSILNRPEFIGWAYEDEFAKLYIHGPPQSGKVSRQTGVRLAQYSHYEDHILRCRGREATV